jgi:hypothetical protein
MPHHLALALREAVDREAVLLRAVAERDASVKPSPKVWSKKEELGHLIDSATNNHVRFVRAVIEPGFRGLGYEQDAWVSLHGYQEMPWTEIIDFWQRYNYFLAGLVRRIPEDRLSASCVVGESVPVTLQFLIEDYTLHMQHHLDHILAREMITEYPGAAVGV